MSLSTFLDLVWTEIWDDAPEMGDKVTHRRIMKELFIDCKDPYNITYEVTEYKHGKERKVTKRLADKPGGQATKSDLDQLRELREKAIAAAAQARSEQQK